MDGRTCLDFSVVLGLTEDPSKLGMHSFGPFGKNQDFLGNDLDGNEKSIFPQELFRCYDGNDISHGNGSQNPISRKNSRKVCSRGLP